MDGSGLTQIGVGGAGASRVRGRAKAAELVGLVLALDERDGLDALERRRLDREIGSLATGSAFDGPTGRAADGPVEALAAPSASPSIKKRAGLALLRAWLEAAPSADLRARIARVESSLALLGWLFAGIGFFFGWAAASALLAIEVHEGRINIVLCLALLVVVPLLMLLSSALGWLWSIRPGVSAGIGRPSLGIWLRSVGLGRLAMRFVAPSIRSDVEVLLGRMTAHAKLYGRVQRGQLLAWSQGMGLGFGLGALVATLAFVVFTDLAFGWSTTLEVEPRQIHRVLAAFATPWARLWPEANPSLELVETTRYFRVAAENHVHVVDPIVFGGWWPFLVMSIAAYVVVPRALVLVAIDRWLGRETGHAMGLTPGVDRLLARLTTPLVETTAEGEESEVGHAEAGLVPQIDARQWLVEQGGDAPIVVRWAELSSEAELQQRLGAQVRLRDAGGRRSLAEDSAVVREAGTSAGGVGLCVRGYEPPVLEILDFLGELRAALGAERPVCVLLAEGNAADRETWRRKLVSLGDPRLTVASIELEAGGADA